MHQRTAGHEINTEACRNGPGNRLRCFPLISWAFLTPSSHRFVRDSLDFVSEGIVGPVVLYLQS